MWWPTGGLSAYGGQRLGGSNLRDRLASFLTRGDRHRRLLAQADVRISVSGIRGKSSTAKRLGELLRERGHGTYTKITGDHPTSFINGRKIAINRRGPRVTLYENLGLVDEFVPQLADSG